MGVFEKHKGSRIFIETANALGAQFKWHIFGVIRDPRLLVDLQVPLVAAHSYYWWDLPRVLKKHKIDLVLLLSLIPESFSLTFFECVAAEVPVISSDNGYPRIAYPEYPFFVDLKKGSEVVIDSINEIDRKLLLPELKEELRAFKRKNFERMRRSIEKKYNCVGRLLDEIAS